MSDLRTQTDTVWTQIVADIQSAMASGGALGEIQELVQYKRARLIEVPTPLLAVINRSVEVVEWNANRGIANLVVQFGMTTSSFDPESAGTTLKDLIWELADLFIENPDLGGLVHDTRINRLNSDDQPPGEELSTQPWGTVEMVWDYDFTTGV